MKQQIIQKSMHQKDVYGDSAICVTNVGYTVLKLGTTLNLDLLHDDIAISQPVCIQYAKGKL